MLIARFSGGPTWTLLGCHGLPKSPTCKWVRIGQVVTRQVNKGAMFRVDKLWLGSHVIGVFHRVSCVDHIHLQRTKRSLKPASHVYLTGDHGVNQAKLCCSKASRLGTNRVTPVTRKKKKNQKENLSTDV